MAAADPTLIAGAALGVAGTLVLAFGIVAALDARYTTRREYETTMKDIDRRLAGITKAVGAEAD
jgi:hypothetical protein